MNIKLYTTPSFSRHMAAIRAEAGQGLQNGVRRNAAEDGAPQNGATITPFPNRRRPSLSEKALAAARANRDGTRDIGGEIEALRLRAEKRLQNDLGVLRDLYDSPALINILETKLAEERRLAAARAPAAADAGGRHD